MDIKEIKQKRSVLGIQILYLIQEFESETEITVTSIELYNETLNSDESLVSISKTVGLKIDIKL